VRPWAIDVREIPRGRTTLLLRDPGKDRVGLREEQMIIRAGNNSRSSRQINRSDVIGTRLRKADYLEGMPKLYGTPGP